MSTKIQIPAFGETEVFGDGRNAPRLTLTLHEDGRSTLAPGERCATMRSQWGIEVYHRRALEWSQVMPEGVRVLADAGKIQAIAEQAQPLIERVRAGHSVEWDGSNMVGRLTTRAREASEALADLLDDCEWTRDDLIPMLAGDWLAGEDDAETLRNLGIDLAEAVAELARPFGQRWKIREASEELVRRAREEDVVLLGAEDEIVARIERLRDAAWEDHEDAPRWVAIPGPGYVSGPRGWLRADWARAESGIMALHGPEGAFDWAPTQWRVADFGHDPERALEVIFNEEDA